MSRFVRSALAMVLLLACAAAMPRPHAAHPAAPAPSSAPAHGPAPAHGGRAVNLSPAPAGLERDTLALVDDHAVTALDLVQRIEWMPWPEKQQAASLQVAKARALESLVAEALLARESERFARADSVALAPASAALRRALLRDALFRDLCAEAPPAGRAEVDSLVRRLHPGAAPGQLPALRRAAADSLRDLHGRERAAAFMVHQLAGRQVRVDSTTFMLLADSLRAYMVWLHDAPAAGGGIIVPAEAPDTLRARLAPALGRTLAQLPGGPWTLGDALEDLRFYLFAVHSLESRRFAAEWNARLRTIVEGELMAREAERRGFASRPEIARDLALWTRAWRAGRATARLAAAVPGTDDDAFRVLARSEPERARNLGEVDLLEILSADRDAAEAVRAALAAGADFDSLARARSRRGEWSASGGRSGFFPVTARPVLGYAALLSPRDSLLGPVRLPEGWSVYRVLGKRLRADSTQAGGLLAEAGRLAAGERRMQAVARHVATLADHARIRIDYVALRRVEILTANMVTRRALGFGGGMLAAPSLLPMWQWTGERRTAPATLP